MNKDDLITKVKDSVGLSKADATKAVDSVFSNISESLKGGTEVRLVGFGTFLVTNRAATTGRNPRTGESIQIPAKKVPKFRAGKALKDSEARSCRCSSGSHELPLYPPECFRIRGLHRRCKLAGDPLQLGHSRHYTVR